MEGGPRPVATVFLGERGESNIVSPPKETAYFSAIFPRGWSQGSPDGPRSSRTAGWGSPGREPPFFSPPTGVPGRPRSPSPSQALGTKFLPTRWVCKGLMPGSPPATSMCPVVSPQGRKGTPGSARQPGQHSIPQPGRVFIWWVNRIERVLGRGKEAKPALMGAGQRWVTLHLSSSHARGQRGFCPQGLGAAGLGAHNFPAPHLR